MNRVSICTSIDVIDCIFLCINCCCWNGKICSALKVFAAVDAIAFIGWSFICPTYTNKHKKRRQRNRKNLLSRYWFHFHVCVQRSLPLFWMFSSALNQRWKLNRGKLLSRKWSLLVCLLSIRMLYKWKRWYFKNIFLGIWTIFKNLCALQWLFEMKWSRINLCKSMNGRKKQHLYHKWLY